MEVPKEPTERIDFTEEGSWDGSPDLGKGCEGSDGQKIPEFTFSVPLAMIPRTDTPATAQGVSAAQGESTSCHVGRPWVSGMVSMPVPEGEEL